MPWTLIDLANVAGRINLPLISSHTETEVNGDFDVFLWGQVILTQDVFGYVVVLYIYLRLQLQIRNNEI